MDIRIIANETEILTGTSMLFGRFAGALSATEDVTLYTWEGGARIYEACGCPPSCIKLWPTGRISAFGVYIHHIYRTIHASLNALVEKIDPNSQNVTIAVSEYWPDLFPALIFKLRNPSTLLVCAFFVPAPNPFFGYEGRLQLPKPNTLTFLITQLVSMPLMRAFADVIIVSNKRIAKMFPKQFNSNNFILFEGGTDPDMADAVPDQGKIYDAVCINRFHPQKNYKSLVSFIWPKVVGKFPDARLALIGDGPQEGEIKDIVRTMRLEGNIVFLGPKEGPDKYKVFKSSRITINPSVYDTGSIGTLEAMSCGLPAVLFDIPDFEEYFHAGTIKVPTNDYSRFSNAIMELLNDEKLHTSTSREALKEARKRDWKTLAHGILLKLKAAGEKLWTD